MTATTDPVARVADALLAAWRGGPAADEQALASCITTADQAYAVQARLLQALDGPEAGAPRHWKSGGPSRETVLTHAPLPAGGVRPSGSSMEGVCLRLRLIEAEVALRLARDVGAAEAATLTPEAAVSLVDGLAVSIEVVDSRWAGGRDAPALLKLADLQSHGGLVLGGFEPWAPRDWAQQECRVRIGTGEVKSFRGTHSLADPAWLLPTWLRHATRDGGTVPAGTVVTTGTWCGLLPAQAGDRVEVEFPGIGRAVVLV